MLGFILSYAYDIFRFLYYYYYFLFIHPIFEKFCYIQYQQIS